MPFNNMGTLKFKAQLINVFLLLSIKCSAAPPLGGTPYNGLYGEAPPERGTFFRLQVYKRVGISQVEVYKRVGKSVVSQRELNE